MLQQKTKVIIIKLFEFSRIFRFQICVIFQNKNYVLIADFELFCLFQAVDNSKAANAVEQFFGIECQSQLKCVEVSK